MQGIDLVFVHLCEFRRLIGCDAGINNLLDITIHDLIQLMEDGIATTDEAERQAIYAKAEHIMTREDWATTPLYNETKFYLLNPSITGFQMDATFRMFWKNADIQ